MARLVCRSLLAALAHAAVGVLSAKIEPASAAIAGFSGADDLVIARGGQTDATVLVSPHAGKYDVARLRFTRLSFEVIDAYTTMVRRAATEGDFASAVDAGRRGVAARDALTAMSKTFTTSRLEKGVAWWTGEVQQYAELAALTDGSRGRLVERLPLIWAARRDPDRTGVEQGFAVEPVDAKLPTTTGRITPTSARSDDSGTWEALRTDLYPGAQGVRQRDQQGFVGDLWYRTDLDLTAAQASENLHLMFPGLFGACALYLDGIEVAHRDQDPLWWRNDYGFQWDVDLAGRLRPGFNGLALACDGEGHFAGMFRRPFLYVDLQK